MMVSGPTCSSDINECSTNSTLCNNGACVNTIGSFICNCSAGYTDKYCTTNINECLSNPCINGVCIDGPNSFRCICLAGFNGTTCQNNINDCPPTNCSGNGICIDGINTYNCNCSGINSNFELILN